MTTDDVPLPLETYAHALVHLLHARTEPLESTLARAGTSLEAFQQAESHWAKELSVAHAERKGRLAMRFAAAFGDAQLRVGFVTKDALSARAAPVDKPSFLKSKETTELDPSVVAAAAMPFRAPSPDAAPADVPARPNLGSASGETAALDPAAVAAGLALAARHATSVAAPAHPASNEEAAWLATRREIEAIAGLQASLDADPAGAPALLRSLALDPRRFEARAARVAELRSRYAEADSIYRQKYEATRKEPR